MKTCSDIKFPIIRKEAAEKLKDKIMSKTIRELHIDKVRTEIKISNILQKLINDYGLLDFSIDVTVGFHKTEKGDKIPVQKIETTLNISVL